MTAQNMHALFEISYDGDVWIASTEQLESDDFQAMCRSCLDKSTRYRVCQVTNDAPEKEIPF